VEVGSPELEILCQLFILLLPAELKVLDFGIFGRANQVMPREVC